MTEDTDIQRVFEQTVAGDQVEQYFEQRIGDAAQDFASATIAYERCRQAAPPISKLVTGVLGYLGLIDNKQTELQTEVDLAREVLRKAISAKILAEKTGKLTVKLSIDNAQSSKT